MTQPTTPSTGVDANDVIDELVAHIGRLSKELAILRAQLKTYTSTAHQVAPAE